ncbi:MAG: hypothetical protein SGJ10_01490, partial [Bacteroidota bacterium]|nr:hypothetical protein [Bacteroidota bacterium]
MKKLLTLILLTACIRFANAQSVGINTTSPDTSAALEIKSNAKGLLIPRLSTTERTNIYSPANGLLVYDSTVNQFYYYNGSAWFGIPNTNYLSANGNDIYNNNSGNVGIGTTSPSEKLQIADANLLNSGTFGSGSSLTISG